MKVWFGPVIRLGGTVGSAPERRAGDPSSNPGPGENFSLKITTHGKMISGRKEQAKGPKPYS